MIPVDLSVVLRNCCAMMYLVFAPGSASTSGCALAVLAHTILVAVKGIAGGCVGGHGGNLCVCGRHVES